MKMIGEKAWWRWIARLQAQAALAYTSDGMVREDVIFNPASRRHASGPVLSDLFNALAGAGGERFVPLARNAMMQAWGGLSPALRDRVDQFVGDHGYTHLDYLGHGGRAVAFRAFHAATGQQRIVRVEGGVCALLPRPVHPTVLQPYVTNQGAQADFGGLKIEVLPRVVPLSRLPMRREVEDDVLLSADYHRAIKFIARGSNASYGRGLFDDDAVPSNVGMLPNGRVVTFDPEFVTGAAARAKHAVLDQKFYSLTKRVAARLYGAAP